ncbi:unnamed protein product [Merluccius merluccius]
MATRLASSKSNVDEYLQQVKHDTCLKMQVNGDTTGAGLLDDNMAEGDLGDGMGKRLTATNLQTRGPLQHSPPSRTESSGSDADFPWTSFTMPYTSLKLRSGSLVDLSKAELRERLQEATEMLEMLRCELEVTHRYLEGKYEALRILQGKTILDKATTHTKSLLQKSEDRAKALEKEVNGLQWEITFNQVQLKKFEQSWEQKFNRVNSENKVLSKSLDERLNEIRELKAENTVVGQQCVELLSMLSVKEQKAYQGTKPPCSYGGESTVLELDLLLRSREEALLMADAFRIAFEQQLRKRSEHFLLLAEARALRSSPSKTWGKSYIPAGHCVTPVGVAQKLRAILPSGLDAKASLEHTDTLHRLLDLLNDKEEALAHQRKVSHMLAHHAEELQKQLPGTPDFQNQKEESSSDIKTKLLEPPDKKAQTAQPLDTKAQCEEPPDARTQPKELPETNTQFIEPPDIEETQDANTQVPESLDTNQPQELLDTKTQRTH